MAKILVIAESGFGKSTSICPNEELGIKGLDPKKTFIVNVSAKDLPARGWKKLYKHIEGKDLSSGNYVETNNGLDIAGLISVMNEKKPEVNTIIVDDFQYIMADYYMDKAKTAGFDKFQDIGYFIGQIFKANLKFKGHIIFLTHPEEVQLPNGGITYRAKTAGKMVNQYCSPEGKFDITLYGGQEFDFKTKKANKYFVTNLDGTYPAKSAPGMMPLHIPNDLGLVIELVNKYYDGE
jgi:hypothetical protein